MPAGGTTEKRGLLGVFIGLTVKKLKVFVELLLAPKSLSHVEEGGCFVELSLGLMKSHLRLDHCWRAARGAFVLQETTVQLHPRTEKERAKTLLRSVVNQEGSIPLAQAS